MYSNFNPFETGRHRQRPHHRSFGPFGLDNGNGCGPHEHGDYPPFRPFGYGLHGGRGGFGPWGPSGPRGRGWGPRDQDDYSSSSEDEDPKKPGEDTSSDSSSDSSSESDVECHGKGRHRRCPHRRGGHGRHGRGHSHGGHGHGGHGGHGHGGHGHGGHGRHRHGRHCFPPHHHHHHRGHSPWENRAKTTEDLPVEDASGFGSDYQVIHDDVVTQMNNLQVQDDGHKDQSTKKSFKVALNADGFKVKDIRIRRHQNQLRVEGKQDAKTYLGTFQRSFAYTITIPSGVNPNKIKTMLGPDGVLRIKAKKSRNGIENEEIEEIPIKE